MRLTLEVDGDVQLDRELLRWSSHTEDVSPAFHEIADDFLAIERKQFASQGGYASGGWTPLSASYAAWKAKHYPGKGILRRTDVLMRSLTDPAAPGAVREITAHEMVVGTTVKYAKYHQHGGGWLPQRRPVELTAADRTRWVKILQKWLAAGDERRSA